MIVSGALSRSISAQRFRKMDIRGGFGLKILVIGKKGRLAHYTRDASLLDKFEVCYVGAWASDEEILSEGRDADFILADAISQVSRNVIEAMPSLKMIHSEGVAFNRIDRKSVV